MRIVLAILVVFVQVAGPWLCCCAPTRMVAVLGGDREAAKMPVAPPKPAGCPHCKTAEQSPEQAPVQQPQPHTPESCPCGGAEMLAVAEDRQKAATLELAILFELLSTPAPFPAVLSQSVAAVPGLRELPILTTAERLFAHHVLRC